MSVSESTVKGKFDELAGKVKQAFGEGTDNNKVANEGAAQEVKGHTEQAWGSVKEGVQDTADDAKARSDARVTAEGHDTREKATSAAEHLKERVEAGVDHLRNR